MQKLRVCLLAAVTLGAAVLFYVAAPAQADVDSVAGSAAPLLIDGNPAVGSGVAGSATEPVDAYGPFSTSLLGGVPPAVSALLSLGLLTANTQGGGVATNAEPAGHLGFATSSASVADVVLGGTNLGVVSAECRADGNGAVGSSVVAGIPTLPAAVPGGTPVPLPNPVPGLPSLLTIFVNDVTAVNTVGTATVTVNAVRVNLLGIDIILSQAVCSATGPDVNVTTTTSTTPPR
jgi:hypothetical protein